LGGVLTVVGALAGPPDPAFILGLAMLGLGVGLGVAEWRALRRPWLAWTGVALTICDGRAELTVPWAAIATVHLRQVTIGRYLHLADRQNWVEIALVAPSLLPGASAFAARVLAPGSLGAPVARGRGHLARVDALLRELGLPAYGGVTSSYAERPAIFGRG
jgi:hypothetical protein